MTEQTFPGLFETKTKEQKLEEWCKSKVWFNKIQLTQYGLDNYYISAWRRVCEWCSEPNPKIKRLDKDEILFRGLWKKGQAHLGWYKFVG